MLKGFGDGLSGYDFTTYQRALDGIRAEIAFDHLTFYTLGAYQSALGYLPRNVTSIGARDGNAEYKRLYAYLHARGISTGVMLQLLSHHQENWGSEIVLGGMTPEKIAEIEEINHAPLTTTPITADFTDERFVPRLLEMVGEQLTLFPDVDCIWLEFEGVNFVPPAAMARVYHRWAAPCGKPPYDQVTYSPETREYCRAIFTEPDFYWSEECREMFREYHRRNLSAVNDYLRGVGYRGKVGLVFHLYGYESRIFPDVLPNPDWWLLPWHYWNLNFEPQGTTPAMMAQKQAVSKASLRRWQEAGHHLCYIGDVALGKNGLEGVKDFYDFCQSLQPAGYLGLGFPDTTIGARWLNVEDADLLAARALYRTLYGE